ncbi:Hypothetical predicted protein [Paramuricea clavata]|uniref:Uncharacterized protein n=1 Tax=Paramuricea clavata TaxID=317549 RepID=A0A6S7JVT8_PARCT|nr:Hypothetical predicted protein [Paramuricea clavata]
MKVDEDSKKYLVVTTPWGNLKHKTFAQGWITSQDEFDRRVNEILAEFPHVKSNRDGCLIGGKDRNEHNRTLDLVLTRLQDHGLTLTLRLEKCEFGKGRNRVLWCQIYGRRNQTIEGESESVARIFAQIALPLRQLLTKSTSTFQWGPIEQEAFDSLKSSLTEQTTLKLSYFVPGRPIRIYVDAGKKTEKSSNVPGGLCAILCQQGLDYVVKYQKGAENIADYGSRHLTRRHDDVPMVKSVNELEEGLRTFVSEDNEYLSRMAKDDNDYQFLKCKSK